MAYFVVALVALGILLGVTGTEKMMDEHRQTLSEIAPGTFDGAQFSRWSVAILSYVQSNPGISGNLTPEEISTAIENQTFANGFPTNAALNLKAWVGILSGYPRVLICSASLGIGGYKGALAASDNNAAFGVPDAAGDTWVSAAGYSGTLPAGSVPTNDTVVYVADATALPGT